MPCAARATLSCFTRAFVVTAGGLVLAAGAAKAVTGTIGGALAVLCICAGLAVLEISLSVDNAIVNANMLMDMLPE